MKNILVYGASGHSKMIIDIIHKNNNYNVIGFIDSFKPLNADIYGYKVLGHLETIPKLVEQHNISGIIIGIGDNATRKKVFGKITKIAPNLEFISVVHPSAVLANNIIIPRGVVIMPMVVVNSDAKIGEFCILNTKSSLGHDSIMSDFSSLASGVVIGGNVKIGLCSAICISASIIQNISIGNHTVIGAASLVLKSIDDYKLAYGIPVDTIKDREPDARYLS